MGIQGSVPRNNYLSKEESFMYDREKSFPMEDTCNEARIEFTDEGQIQREAVWTDMSAIIRQLPQG